jgi:hypothetical protein
MIGKPELEMIAIGHIERADILSLGGSIERTRIARANLLEQRAQLGKLIRFVQEMSNTVLLA